MILIKDNNGKIHQTTDGTNTIVPSLNVAQEVLWTNPNPNQDFVGQSINTSSPMTDFDYLIVKYKETKSEDLLRTILVTPQKNFTMQNTRYANTHAWGGCRVITYVNETTLNIADCYERNNHAISNTDTIPYQIIGIKFLDTLNYSTEEQYTGKHWIDGKKIYQKTFYFTNTKSGQYTQNLPNFGQLISLEGSINSPATSWVPITYSNPGNVNNYTATAFVENITETSIVLNLSMGSGLGTPANIYVTLRYTKTTE